MTNSKHQWAKTMKTNKGGHHIKKCDLDSILSKKIACIVLNTSDI